MVKNIFIIFIFLNSVIIKSDYEINRLRAASPINYEKYSYDIHSKKNEFKIFLLAIYVEYMRIFKHYSIRLQNWMIT
jgi:hypothetical protein